MKRYRTKLLGILFFRLCNVLMMQCNYYYYYYYYFLNYHMNAMVVTFVCVHCVDVLKCVQYLLGLLLLGLVWRV